MRFRLPAAMAALTMLTTSVAQAAEPPLMVSYPTDGSLSCEQLTAEIARMDSITGTASQAAASAQGAARAAELGASVGINAALYSGALGRVPGLGLLGNAASQAAKANAAAKQRASEERIRTAETRRAMLGGMYSGKSCGVAAAVAPAAPAAAPAQTASVAPVS